MFSNLVLFFFGFLQAANPVAKNNDVYLMHLDSCRMLSFPEHKLQDSVFYKFVYSDSTPEYSTYCLVWGKKGLRISKSHSFKHGAGSSLNYVTCSSKFLIFMESCGTECGNYIVLPIDGGHEKSYFNMVAFDPENSLVAYMPTTGNENGSVFIIVENCDNGKKTYIKEQSIINFPPSLRYDCIDCCYFKDGKLVLKWSDDKNVLQQRIIKMII